MSGVYWLASYPKSGNTWLRLLLQSCLAGGAEVEINSLSFGHLHAQDRQAFDEAIGASSADLTAEEILAWRPAALRVLVGRTRRPIYAKTHDARLAVPGGEPLIPPDLTLGSVYLVRDPRDVALSLSRHLDQDLDRIIALMARRDQRMAVSQARLRRILPEVWGSWSQNVESWLDAPEPTSRLVRFEDLRADPAAVFGAAQGGLGFAFSEAVIRAAVSATALERLRDQEARDGFLERPNDNPFFGNGKVGGWREAMTAAQAARIETDHGQAMRRLGYLD